MTGGTASMLFRLAAFVREEDGVWVAGCSALDVFSQGDSAQEARRNLQEAVQLWIESCVARDVLTEALEELGWSNAQGGTRPPPGGVLATASSDRIFALEVEIPAYQAAEALEASAGAG